MNNPKKPATLSPQDAGRRQSKQTKNNTKK